MADPQPPTLGIAERLTQWAHTNRPGATIAFWVAAFFTIRGLTGVVMGALDRNWLVIGLSTITLGLAGSATVVLHRARRATRPGA